MKTFLKLSALSLVLATLSSNAMAITANSSGIVVTQISIAEVTPLFFGKFATPVAGTIQLSPALATVKTVAGVSALSTPAATAGKFTVSGDTTSTYAITLQSGSINLTGPGTAMTVDTFTSSPSGTGTLTAGTQTVYVGGILHAAAAQTAGTYSGTYTITVAYN